MTESDAICQPRLTPGPASWPRKEKAPPERGFCDAITAIFERVCPKGSPHCVSASADPRSVQPSDLGVTGGWQVLRQYRGAATRRCARRERQAGTTVRESGRAADPDDVIVGVRVGGQTQDILPGLERARIGLVAVGDRDVTAGTVTAVTYLPVEET
jgi:hypothetical protein